jgi:glucosamine 6-phosphate synthetase-like amidotransferase/phosphosugar isomerase protein
VPDDGQINHNQEKEDIMCGVFGFVAKEDNTISLDIIREVAEVTMTRGPHAWGIAWVDRKRKLHMFKQSGQIVDSLGLLAMAKDATMLIGHCRWATHGDYRNNLNNHPHPADGGWIVHNGMIHHYKEIIDSHDLHPMTECDSEVLGLLIERANGKLIDRCGQAVQVSRGRSPLVMLGLWKDRLVAARANGQPLHIGETGKSYYIASLPGALPGQIKSVKDGEVLEFGDAK